MTAAATARIEPPPGRTDSAAAAWLDSDHVLLERFLARRRSAEGGPTAPVVGLGLTDLAAFGSETPAVFVRARRDGPDGSGIPVGDQRSVFLTPRSILLGPVWSATLPCPYCLALRYQKVRAEQERAVIEQGRPLRPVGRSPYLTPFVLDAASQLLTAVEYADPGRQADPGPRPGSSSLVYELALSTLRVSRYPLIADPACPVCTRHRSDGPDAARLTLVPRAKTATGRYRLCSPEDYRLPREALVNPVCGVLGAAALADLSCPTTAPVAGHIKVRSRDRLLDLTWSGHADSYDASMLLAVLEGLERYAGSRQRRYAGTLIDSYRNLGADALDPRDCGVYTDDVYAAGVGFTAFTPDLRIPWVWGYSLRDGRPILVPERIAYFMGRDGDPNFVHECSNGCAGGSCLEEAILFGMLELIERDAFLIGWYGRACLPEIDLGSVRGRSTRHMLDRVRRCGYEMRLFDNRVDLQVPVVTGVAVRRDGGLGTLCFASGASFDPEDAVRAALCEIASYIPSLPARVSARLPELRAMADDFSKVAELPDHAALFGLPEMRRHAGFLLRRRATVPMDELYRGWRRERPATLDLCDDVQFCRDLFVAAGFDVIVVDQTCPEQEAAGLRSVCVIVPGLLPIDFGWRKQRALHLARTRVAPRRAGWRTTDLSDVDLHLVPHPFP